MNEPVPVLLSVYRLTVGGNERDLSKLARTLNPRLFQPHVACFHPEGERKAELEEAGIPILHLPVKGFKDKSALAGARQLRAYVKQHKIQLIHSFDDPTSIFCVPLGRLFGVPAVLSSHCYFRNMIAPPNYHALRMVDMLAHRIVVNAHAIKTHLIRDYGVAADRIFVSHNGVETGSFFPQPVTRPDYLSGASCVIGSLCVFRDGKQLDVLIRAFARVRHLDPNMRLLLVGDGVMRDAWMRLSDELGLGTSCHFEKATTEVPYWLRCMDIFVLPSKSEGFPNVVLESMACGCAPLATNVGGIPELLESGRSGFLFEPGDDVTLANLLEKLITNPALRRQMSSTAAVVASSQFNMETTARRMEKFYRSVLRLD